MTGSIFESFRIVFQQFDRFLSSYDKTIAVFIVFLNLELISSQQRKANLKQHFL